ncbi:MAG: hypothetical protein COT35_06840 [Nitrospirae bacterium CG08_land_8_20_14_0_20_52_24]|nr:MAG: hypothetical protein COT35_06840 [Nitrospirae bacterium CG08_land_8_20_14_0_20_52_24]PIX86562.1 MAG: hypothetical protein COZ32_02640 [Nitrospirae bacterium CG_4_10_14_3_um_filter_53_41]
MSGEYVIRQKILDGLRFKPDQEPIEEKGMMKRIQVLIIVIILGFYGIANASPTGTLTYVGRLGSDLTRLPKLRPKNLVTD